ncbi:MAG: hypothetical protein JSV85_02610 [Candidatus Bathyarchaeota archaeon]|nr:MAG: hypothetical protein JSV85_02610 [Candidatus Bathyarchaeota archaeon]
MKTHAVINMDFPSKELLKTVIKALRPETEIKSTHRSKVRVESKGKTLVVCFEAEDTSALRAAINSYLRWVLLTKRVLKSVDGFTSINEQDGKLQN